MEVKKGYKQTEVGVIPEDWEVKKLGDIAEIIMGQSPLGVSYNQNEVGIALINGPTEFTEKYPIKVQWTTLPTKLCKKGDILLCVRGSSTGRKNTSNDIYCIGRGIAAIRARINLDNSFLEFLIQVSVKSILTLTTGSTFPNIDGKSLRNIAVITPPIPDQQAIAAALSDVDALITSLDQFITKKRNIKQGAMQELLTGKKRLTGFMGEWERKELVNDREQVKKGHLGDFFELSPSKKQMRNNEIVSFLGMEDVSESGKVLKHNEMCFSEVKKGLTYFEKNDILVAKITPCFENGKGTCLDSLKTEKGFGSTEFHVLRAKDYAVPRYIFYQTQMDAFRKKLETEMIGTAGQKRVPSIAIINYPLPVIHSKEEQRAIAQILMDMDAEIEKLEQQRDKYKAIKQGMMQELLTGKTRLI